MRRGRIFFYLAFILILGLVAVVVIMYRFNPGSLTTATAQEATPVPTQELVNVVVATQRISRGDVISDAVVGMVPIPKDVVMQTMLTQMGDAVGRQARFDLDAGIPLTQGMLASSFGDLSTYGSNAALNIPAGMVAVSIPIKDSLSSVSYAPQPGDHVNVIVSMLFVDMDSDFQTILPNQTGNVIAPGVAEGGTSLTAQVTSPTGQGRAEIDPVLGQTLYVVPSEQQRPRMVAQTLLQDAIVLYVGNYPVEGDTPQTPTVQEGAQQIAVEEQVPEEQQQVIQVPDVITLVVSPQDAVTLNYILFSDPSAKMTLALRPAADDTRVQTEAVTLQFLLDQYNIPVPVKLPYGLSPRRDVLGLPYVQPPPAPATAPEE